MTPSPKPSSEEQLRHILEGVWHSRSIDDVIPELLALIDAARIDELTRLDYAHEEVTPESFHEYYLKRLAELKQPHPEAEQPFVNTNRGGTGHLQTGFVNSEQPAPEPKSDKEGS